MHKSFLKQLLSFILAALMLFGVLTSGVLADGEPEADPEITDGGSDVEEAETEIKFHNNLAGGDSGASYESYSNRYADVPKAEKSIVIDATQYDAANTTAEVKVLSNYEGAEKALYMPSNGLTSWKVTIPTTAKYAIRITYFPLTELDGTEVTTATTIERTLFVDGRIPFSESRYFYFPRNWTYEDAEVDEAGYRKFKVDANGNDVRPIRYEHPTWQTYYLRDWLGYTMDPFEFALTAGEHVLSFDASREGIVISEIELYRYDAAPSYEEFLAQKKSEGVKVIENIGEVIKIQAENPALISNACLYPTNDRTSSLSEPQDPQKIRNNMVNSTKVNEWMKYTVNVPEDGLYSIAIRFRQNDLIGMFTSRRILVNDELQFAEASCIRFKYKTSWQSQFATDGANNYMFYLKKGENTITFETVLGDMTDYVYRVEQVIESLNDAYKEILQLTGPTPDAYNDYGFNRLVPDAVDAIAAGANELYTISGELETITGELGDQVATLNTIALLLDTMAKDEYKIAPNFVTFKNYIIALSNWLYAALNQPCKIDFFTVQGCKDPLPKDKSNFFQTIGFEFMAFIGSFKMDYTTVDFATDVEYSAEDTVTLWITSALGREDALIKRNLVDTYFTPETGITVKMKVITTGLTEAILAKMGPDAANMSSVDTITWGLRNAVEALDQFDDYKDTTGWFSDAIIEPLTIKNAKGEEHVYGLPYTSDFMMMFYRADVLQNLGVDVPKTWQDLYDILPALLNADMIVGMPGALSGTTVAVDSLAGYKIFLYQMGGELYNADGYTIAVDENVGLDAFEEFTEMFSQYQCEIEYDITRFRTGEMPIYFGSAVSTYNTLMSYYDIRGLWEMSTVLGTEQEDGSINIVAPVTVTSYVLPRGSNKDAAWKYIKWAVSPDQQKRLARETLAVNANPTTKYNTATIDALIGQAWTEEEYAAISEQVKNLVGIREYAGQYIVKTYVDAAFLQARSNNSDASDELLDRVILINKELARKRDDFKMDYIDPNTGKWVPGRYITEMPPEAAGLVEVE